MLPSGVDDDDDDDYGRPVLSDVQSSRTLSGQEPLGCSTFPYQKRMRASAYSYLLIDIYAWSTTIALVFICMSTNTTYATVVFDIYAWSTTIAFV